MTYTEKVNLTRRRLYARIEKAIEESGFEAVYDKWQGPTPQVKQDKDAYISIAIREMVGAVDYTEGWEEILISARASVCRSNPNSNVQELKRAASKIRRGADLVEAINDLGLQYTLHYRKYQEEK